MRPTTSQAKSSPHRSEKFGRTKQKFLLLNNENRLVPIENNRPTTRHPHRKQIEDMRQELSQALQNIRYIAAHCAHESLIESIRDEWKFIATVIDRLQFIIFLLVTLFGSLALLFQVKSI